ncbi:MAG: PfkB family carbohydrate kinase, partial [Anaerolineales bacterium]
VPVHGEIDIVGAGDTALAAITAALGVGATPPEAALLGNLAASVTIQCLGATGTASPSQIMAAYEAWSAGR